MAEKSGSRERLLNAAVRLFEQRGYGSVTMGEIAEEAGLSRPTAYRHFTSKEDILWALTEQAGEHTSHIVATVASSSASPAEQLRTLIRNHAQILVKHRVVFRLTLRTQLELNDARRKQLAEAQRQYLHVTANIIEAGVRQGEFRSVHATTAAEGILGMTQSVIDWYRDRGPLPLDDVADQFVDIVLTGLLVPGEVDLRARGRSADGQRSRTRTAKRGG
jgi:AcrR family transcriptional regulator